MSNKGGGSKFLVGLLCFLLGFIIAIASIVGVVFVGIFYDLDSIFSLVGVDNTDEDGNYIYVNTDSENGGASNLYELVTAIINYAGDYGNMTLGDLETLIPAASSLTDSLVSLIVEYVDTDEDELRDDFTATPLSELGTFFSDLINGIQAVSLIEQFAPDMMGDDAAGVIIKAILLGKEADYVTDDNGTTYPVYYDVYKPVYDLSGGIIGYMRYTADEDGEYTVQDTDAVITSSLTGDLYDLLVPVYEETEETESGSTAVTASFMLTDGTVAAEPTIDYCYLYYFNYMGYAFATDGDFTYSLTAPYGFYDETAATLSGKYYYDNEGERVIVTPVTIGDLSDSNAITDSLNDVKLTDIMDVEEGDTMSNILGGYTIGDIINGNVDFDSVELTDVLSAAPSNTAMVVILYSGVTSIQQDSEGNWTCKYTDDDGEVHTGYITVDDDGNISHIYYYVTYGEGGYALDAEGNYYEAEGGTYTQMEVAATTIGGISDVVDTLTLISLMDPVEPDDALMMYIMYGVTGVEYDETNLVWTGSYTHTADDGTDVTETVTIETYFDGDGTELVDSVYYLDGEGAKISTATTVNGASDVLNGLQDEFEISAVLDDIEPDDAILIYISYKVNNVKAVETTDGEGVTTITYVGTYTADDNTKYEAVLKTKTETVQTTVDAGTEGAIAGTNESGETYYYTESTVYYVTGAYYTDGEGNQVKIKGTTINQMTDRINGLMDDLTLSELIGDTSDNTLLDKLGDATINTLSDKINALAIQEIYPEDIYTYTVTNYLEVVADSTAVGDDTDTKIAFADIGSATLYTYDSTTGTYTAYKGDAFEKFADMSGTTYYIVGDTEEFSSDMKVVVASKDVTGYDATTMVVFDADYLYYVMDEDGDYVLVDYDNDDENLGKLTAAQYTELVKTTTVYSYGEASGAWWFMLYGEKREVTDKDGNTYTYTGEEAYNINSIAKLMDNVTRNIGDATLYELQDAGIITSNTLDSDTRIVDHVDEETGVTYYVKIGDLTIDGLLSYVASLST